MEIERIHFLKTGIVKKKGLKAGIMANVKLYFMTGK
jgi:hypothetical protein